MDPLRTWIIENKFTSKSENNEEASHLLFNGGTLWVPRIRERDFLKKYAESIEYFKSNDKPIEMYYIEKRLNIFKFIIDVDYLSDHYLSEEEIMKISYCISSTVATLYDENDSFCILCKSGPKTKQDLIHTGIHIIFPKLFVISEVALYIREKILIELFKIEKNTDWNTFIDKVIYTRNGFRMIGSDKMNDKVPENRIYWPFSVIKNKSPMNIYYERIMKNYEQMMFDTSIRYIPENYIILDNTGMIPKDFVQLITGPNISSGIKNSFNTVDNCADTQLIEHIIKKTFNVYEKYPRLVSGVLRTPMNNLLVKVRTKFCMNMMREHNSCGIYFMIYDQGIVQKCLCPCFNLNNRINGLCKDYSSKIIRFPVEYKHILFPVPSLIMYEEPTITTTTIEDQKKSEISKEKIKEKKNIECQKNLLENICSDSKTNIDNRNATKLGTLLEGALGHKKKSTKNNSR